MQILAKAAESLSPIPITNSREIDSINTSSAVSTVTLQTSPDGKCERIGTQPKLRDASHSGCKTSRRLNVVDSVHRDQQWQVNDCTETRNPYNNRCQQQGLGSMEQYVTDKWTLDARGDKIPPKCKRIESRNDGSESFHKESIRSSNSTSYGQCDSSSASEQEGKPILETTSGNNHRTMGILCREESGIDSSIPTRREEYEGGFIVEELVGDKQLEIEQLVFK